MNPDGKEHGLDIYSSKLPLLFAPKGKTRWAITLGWITVYSVAKEEVNPAWRRHEEQHKKQWRRGWYLGFAILYLWYLARHGYTNNPFEIEARYAETEAD